jgi:hypothetical protein
VADISDIIFACLEQGKAPQRISLRLNTMHEHPHNFTCPKCGRHLGEQYDDVDDMNDDFESWEGYAQLYYDEDFPGLVKYCEAQLARRPADMFAYYDLGRAYVLNHQYQEAIDFTAECHRQEPDDVAFQHIILDALFALGKSEDDFPWLTVPTILRLDESLIDFYYEFLKPKRKPRSIADLYSEPQGRGYLAFSYEELRQALAGDERFEVDTDGPCYRAEVKVKRKRRRNRCR